jgi:hypothetical protein
MPRIGSSSHRLWWFSSPPTSTARSPGFFPRAIGTLALPDAGSAFCHIRSNAGGWANTFAGKARNQSLGVALARIFPSEPAQ